MKQIFCFIMVGFMLQNEVQAQINPAIENADTTNFSINKEQSWSLYSSYISAESSDSCHLELVFEHANSLDWNNFQYFGKIKSYVFFPAETLIVNIQLLENVYALKIDNEGKCYIKFISGIYPQASNVVLPIQLNFKRSN